MRILVLDTLSYYIYISQMKSLRIIIQILVAIAVSQTVFAGEKSTFNLSGEWQVLFDKEGTLGIEEASKTTEGWKAITVPHYKIEGLNEKDTKIVWLRRNFDLDEKLTAFNSILRWKQIFFDAVAYINGSETGKSELTAPFWVKIEKGVLKTGKNTIYLKIFCWSALPKTEAGKALIPAGSASFDWGDRAAKVSGEIFLDFYDDIYIINTVVLPNLKDSSAKIKIWLLKEKNAVSPCVDLLIRDKNGEKIVDSTFSAEGENPVSINAVLKNPVLWDTENPYLYTCELTARASGVPYLNISHFGMREFLVKDGDFYLNGKRIVLKGSELVMDWQRSYLKDKNAIYAYAVETAKQMNFNCFRTHTLPPPESWLDIFDKNGMLILAEFPLTFNKTDFKFNKEQEKLFQENSTLDALTRILELANHPSIIGWVISNESKETASGWETEILSKAIKNLDPSRPVLRAGELTEEGRDIHPYQGYWFGTEGSFYSTVTKFAASQEVSHKNKTMLATEYLEAFNVDRQLRWAGKKKETQKDDIIYAEFCAEQTEVLRRLDFDAILPYWYANWNNPKTNFEWRKDIPSPALAAIKSAFSPIFASIDLFNRNFISGSSLKTDIYYINDTDKPVDAEYNFYITVNNPEYVPYSETFLKPFYSATVLKTLKPYERLIQSFEWKLPENEGIYYFSVVTQTPGLAPALSQREIHAISRSKIPSISNKITLAGSNGTVEEYLTANRISFTKEYYDGIESNLLLTCSLKEFQNEYTLKNQVFESFFEKGGTAVILEDESNVPVKVPVELKTISDISSRAFIAEKDSPLLFNIKPSYLARWNDYNGICYKDPVVITTHAPDDNKTTLKAILTGAKPEESPLVVYNYKKGRIILSRLELKKRISPRTPSYDPVAERMFLNLISAAQ